MLLFLPSPRTRAWFLNPFLGPTPVQGWSQLPGDDYRRGCSGQRSDGHVQNADSLSMPAKLSGVEVRTGLLQQGLLGRFHFSAQGIGKRYPQKSEVPLGDQCLPCGHSSRAHPSYSTPHGLSRWQKICKQRLQRVDCPSALHLFDSAELPQVLPPAQSPLLDGGGAV